VRRPWIAWLRAAHPLQALPVMRDALIGTIVEERYLVESQLGAGAMGRVYRARHIKVGREVAVKVMRADLACEAQIVERFAREAQVAAMLQHPNVVGVLDVGTTPAGEQLMVMDLAPGVPLAELIGAPMPRARVVGLVAQLLRGLSHAHAAGLVHRDLKPDNVLVDSDDHARIVDFGIAVLRDRSGAPAGRRLTDAGHVVGTPMYMAPEQASGKAVDHRADLFALGVIMYELLSGVTPFEGTGAEVAFANVTMDPPLIAERARGVGTDPLLEAFARKLMARRPDARFATAHAALQLLELMDHDRIAAARELFAETPLQTPLQPAEAAPSVLRLARGSDALSTLPMAEPVWTTVIARTPRRTRGPIIGVAAAVAVLGVALGWALLRDDSPRAIAQAPALASPPPPAMIELPEPPLPPPAVAPPVIADVPHVTTRHAVRADHARPSKIEIERRAEVPAPARDESAEALATRYQAIGNALRKARGADELWQRYRLIHLGDAMATPAAREQAFAALDAIEHALPAHS